MGKRVLVEDGEIVIPHTMLVDANRTILDLTTEISDLQAKIDRLLALLDADDDTRERLAALVGSAYPWIDPHPLDVVDMVLAALREEVGDER